MRRIPYILLVAVAAMACNTHLSAPQLAIQKSYIFGGGFSSDSIRLDNNWWQMFGDTTLNRLVERAIARNKNIEIAASRIEEARHNLVVARSQYMPSVSGTISAEGKYDSATNNIAQSYKITPQASWELPLFGSLRHTTQKARANIQYAEWQRRGMELSVAAQAAEAYFTLLQYRQDLSIARRTSELRREMVVLIDSLHRFGFATGVNLEQAKSLLYTSEVDIPRYEYAIAQTILSLASLLGEEPSRLMRLADSEKIPSLKAPSIYDVAIGVPSDILQQRPDMMSAYFTLQATAAEVGIARVARLPSFVLTLFGGTATDKVSKLFSGDAWVAKATLALTQPIYNFGGLRRQELAAREAYRQSVLSYEQTFVEALTDVENALVNITSSREELVRYGELVKSYSTIATTTNALYLNGLSSYLDVIDAERSLYTSQMEQANLVAQQYINLITLYKALGGGR